VPVPLSEKYETKLTPFEVMVCVPVPTKFQLPFVFALIVPAMTLKFPEILRLAAPPREKVTTPADTVKLLQ
jgi:hypothetical protein